MSQPNPRPNTSTPVWDLVIEDMRGRDKLGRERYGVPLQAHNGRDPLLDAYEEALDLVVYLKQALEERNCVLLVPFDTGCRICRNPNCTEPNMQH